jgi:hypothetical protein
MQTLFFVMEMRTTATVNKIYLLAWWTANSSNTPILQYDSSSAGFAARKINRFVNNMRNG